MSGSFEILKKMKLIMNLIRNITFNKWCYRNFLGEDFLSVNKNENINWEDLKHIIISFINEYYSDGKEFIIDKKLNNEKKNDFSEIEKKIIKILEKK